MKRYLLVFLMSCSVAHAAAFFDVGIGGGYRQDRIDWTYWNGADAVILESQYKDIRSPQIEGFIRGLYKFLYLSGHSSYAWIVSGKNWQQISIDPSIGGGPPSPIVGVVTPFEMKKIRGHLFDIEGKGGLAIPLWEKEEKRLYFTFLGGYSYFRQSFNNSDFIPVTGFSSILPASLGGANLVSVTPDIKTRTKFKWWGPLIGANLDLRCSKIFEVDVEYTFHILDVKETEKVDLLIQIFAPPGNTLFVTQLSDVFLHAKFIDAHGHRVRGRCAFYIFNWWKLGLSGSFFHANTEVQRKQVQEQTTVPVPPTTPLLRFTATSPAKIKWNTYNVLLESTFTF